MQVRVDNKDLGMVERQSCLKGKGETAGPLMTSMLEMILEMAGDQGPHGTNHICFREVENQES